MVAFSRVCLAAAACATAQAARGCPDAAGGSKPSTTLQVEVTRSTKLPEAQTTQAASSSESTQSNSLLEQFKPGVRWNICLHNPIDVEKTGELGPEDTKVFDIDLGHALSNDKMIPTLKKAGKFVVCYFNGGAVQVWDDDKAQFQSGGDWNKEFVGKSLGDEYEGEEFYVDIRNSKVVDIMKARLDRAAKAGCDAVDPDNIDAFTQDDAGNDRTGFNLKGEDYVKYLTQLADHAHAFKTGDGNKLLVGQKNAPEIAADLVHVLDFAVLEECRATPEHPDWAFCDQFQPYVAAGKPVLQIEYPPSVEKSKGTLSASDKDFYCKASADDKDFSKVMKWSSPQLDGWTQFCDSDKSFTLPKGKE